MKMSKSVIERREKLSDEFAKYPRMKLWLMHNLRMEHLENALEDGEEYIDDAHPNNILEEFKGPQDHLYRLLANRSDPNNAAMLEDVAKDFGLEVDQLCAIYKAFPNKEDWVSGNIQEMYRTVAKTKPGTASDKT
jgi:hypothetical protein